MSLSASIKCTVTVTTPSVFPGDAVEGYVVLEVLDPLQVRNVHLKIVGRESVHTLVDHVSQSKLKTVQFGISSQDYVYFRELTTLVGDLLSVKRGHMTPSSFAAQSPQVVSVSTGGVGASAESRELEPSSDHQHPLEGVDDNISILIASPMEGEDSEQVNLARSFAMTNASLAAAVEGRYVTLPVGTYTYPFRYLLPEHLPPSYDTGLKTREKQFSNSQASLQYYVKAYVVSPRRRLASQRAPVTVKAMGPELCGMYPAPMGTPSFGQQEEPEPRIVECRFNVRGTGLFGSCCGGGLSDTKLIVRMKLGNQVFRIDDAARPIKVLCVVMKNTSSQPINGLRVSLMQTLTFHTVQAKVPITLPVLSQEVAADIQPGDVEKAMSVTLPPIPSNEDIMPTMATNGLVVEYSVLVELLVSPRIVYEPFYSFEGVVVEPPMETGSTEPAATTDTAPHVYQQLSAASLFTAEQMSFSAMPPGRLTKREAYYAVPAHPCVEAVLPEVEAPVTGGGRSVSASQGPSRQSSALHH